MYNSNKTIRGLVLSMVLVTCCTACVNLFETNLSGSWTALLTTTYTNTPDFAQLGGQVSAWFSISDIKGNLTVSNIIDSSSIPVHWNGGNGTRSGSHIICTIHGWYYNTQNQLVTVELNLDGTTTNSSGQGTWRETFSLPGYQPVISSGNFTMNK